MKIFLISSRCVSVLRIIKLNFSSRMADLIPKLKLTNGQEIPQLGLGTWRSDPNLLIQAVKDAIDIGYRHFDCAFIYGNELQVGQAIQEKIEEGVVTREDLFITSKVWNTFHSKAKTIECVQNSLKNLQMNYLDLCLIHWPMGYQEGGDLMPKDAKDEFIFSDIDYVETWQGLEECYQRGLIRSIGLSNFNSEQILRVVEMADVKPVVLQVECHPYLNQSNLLEFCKDHGITFTAYSCLGSPNHPWSTENEAVVLEDPTIKEIAQKHSRTPAQVCLRFQIQRGVVVIPKSVTKERILSNSKVFDFELSEEEMMSIINLNRDSRIVHLNWIKNHKYYPFSAPF